MMKGIIMKNNNLILLILIILFSLFGISCRGTDGKSKNEPSVNVQVEVVKPTTLVDAIQVVGTIKALEDVNISPEEGGIVKEIIAKKGQYVRKNELIIVLKDELLKASLEAAEAAYNTAQVNLDAQTKVYQEKGISELAYKNLIYNRDATKAQYEIARVRWERTQIKSPINGIVENIIPNVGEFAPPGVPIARVVNTSFVKVQAEVPEWYSGSISVGTPALITVDAIQDDTLKGKVTFVGSTVSSVNRALLVEIALPNSSRKVKPEMIARVKLLRNVRKTAILIDEYLVQLVDRDRKIVYVENNGKAEERVVETGVREENKIEIIKGLKNGDRLITSGFQKLANGTTVTVNYKSE